MRLSLAPAAYYFVNPYPLEPLFRLTTHMHNRYHESEKADDMQNQDGNLNLRQYTASNGIDEDGNEDEAPEE